MNEYKDVVIIKPPKYNKLQFNVEEIIIQCGKLQLKLPKFWAFEDIDEITFNFNGEKHVYKKVKGGRL